MIVRMLQQQKMVAIKLDFFAVCDYNKRKKLYQRL